MAIIPFTERKIVFGSDSIDDSDLCTETESMQNRWEFWLTLLVPYGMNLQI